MEEITMNANLMMKTIEMTRNEAKAAGKIGSEKFKELREYVAMYPGFEIQVKAPAKRKAEFKGLDYKYMRNYIQKHDDETQSIMAEFNTLTAQDKKDGKEGSEYLEAASYLEVRDWFLAKFPEIRQNKEAHDKKILEILNAA